jgi:hypothetical protein
MTGCFPSSLPLWSPYGRHPGRETTHLQRWPSGSGGLKRKSRVPNFLWMKGWCDRQITPHSSSQVTPARGWELNEHVTANQGWADTQGFKTRCLGLQSACLSLSSPISNSLLAHSYLVCGGGGPETVPVQKGLIPTGFDPATPLGLHSHYFSSTLLPFRLTKSSLNLKGFVSQ